MARRFATQPATILWEEVDSPIGAFLVAGDDTTVTNVRLPGRWSKEEVPTPWTYAPGSMAHAARQLDEYFAGSRQRFDLVLAPKGTAFQLEVWRALTAIPFGRTASYGEIASAIGNPRATRAVGLANNRNPIALIVPCHRVIGADGSLTGYGGGLEMKTWLLDHERAVVRAHRPA